MIQLRYDTTALEGSKEHYFHFLHGYLLPGLSLCLKAGFQRARFEDCGPLMNLRLHEACRLAAIEAGPPIADDTAPGQGGDDPVMPRWDKPLLRYNKPMPDLRQRWAYRSQVGRLRARLLRAARRDCRDRGSLATWKSIDVLVIERSPEHAFYQAGGGASIPTYGRGRRALQNTDEIAAHLGTRGRSALAIDIGSLPLSDQIMAFHNASAVVGVRGAEFANLIWMRRRSRAVMFSTPVRARNNGACTLADIYGIRFVSPEVETDFISINPKAVEAYLGQ